MEGTKGGRSGVNVVGFFRAEFGQGEAARRLVAALERAGLPVRTITYDRIPHRQEHPFEERAADGLFPTNIVCLNAEHLLASRAARGASCSQAATRSGSGSGRRAASRRELRPALDFVDEVWVASPFVPRRSRRETRKPVLTFPLPVLVPPAERPHARRPRAARRRVRLRRTSFDFFSTIQRKNPLGLIEAFTRAFPEPGRALLYLKSINGDRSPEATSTGARGGRGSGRTSGSTTATSRRDRLTALTAALRLLRLAPPQRGLRPDDRGGDGAREAGIATGYSGNLAFMDEESASSCRTR